VSKLIRVLIVEDEDAIRLTLRDYLKKLGFDVLVSSDGVGAIKHLLDNEIDVIVSDYRMDIFGGDYWMRFLDRYCSDKKIFITSGFIKQEFKTPFTIMVKPFDYAKLAELIMGSAE